MSPPDRPLKLGELLAETVSIYGARVRAALGLGLIYAGALLAGAVVHVSVYYAITAIIGWLILVFPGEACKQAGFLC